MKIYNFLQKQTLIWGISLFVFLITVQLTQGQEQVMLDEIPPSIPSPIPPEFTKTTNPFPDINPNTLAGKAALDLYERHITQGHGDGKFHGDWEVSRAEAVKFLLLAKGNPINGGLKNNGQFPDVVEGEWYVPYVITASQLGIVKGYADGRFGPTDKVKIGQFLKMLAITFDYTLEPTQANPGRFGLEPEPWFQKFLFLIDGFSLLQEYSSQTIDGYQVMTRDEVAIMLYQNLQKINNYRKEETYISDSGQFFFQYPKEFNVSTQITTDGRRLAYFNPRQVEQSFRVQIPFLKTNFLDMNLLQEDKIPIKHSAQFFNKRVFQENDSQKQKIIISWNEDNLQYSGQIVVNSDNKHDPKTFFMNEILTTFRFLDNYETDNKFNIPQTLDNLKLKKILKNSQYAAVVYAEHPETTLCNRHGGKCHTVIYDLKTQEKIYEQSSNDTNGKWKSYYAEPFAWRGMDSLLIKNSEGDYNLHRTNIKRFSILLRKEYPLYTYDIDYYANPPIHIIENHDTNNKHLFYTKNNNLTIYEILDDNFQINQVDTNTSSPDSIPEGELTYDLDLTKLTKVHTLNADVDTLEIDFTETSGITFTYGSQNYIFDNQGKLLENNTSN